MTLDWLFGPRVLGSGPTWVRFNTFRLDVTDVEEIVEVFREHGPTEVFRGRIGEYQQPTYDQSIDDLSGASDADLARIRITAGPREGRLGQLSLLLSRTEATLTTSGPELDAAIRRRITQLITENGHRRIQRSRLVAFGVVVLAVALAFIPIWTAIAVWPEAPLVVVSGLVAFLTWLNLSGRIRGAAARRNFVPGAGGVIIDATTRTARRAQRWDSRRDIKVAAITAAVTLTAAVVTGWATGLFT